MIKTIYLIVFALFLSVTQSSFAQDGWVIDPSTSSLEFVAKYQGDDVTGRFRQFNADVVFDPKNLSAAHADITIDLTSMTTGHLKQDETLQGADFFDLTAGFAQARYKIHEFKNLGDNQFLGRGVLQLKGKSQPVDTRFTFIQTNNQAVITGQSILNRLDYNIGDRGWRDTKVIPNQVLVRYVLNAKIMSSQNGATPLE